MLSVAPATAQEEEEDGPSASFSTDIFSQYVWRGYGLSKDSAVIQPSMTIGYKGFSVNMWGNFDTDENFVPDGDAKWNETDFTFSYSHEFYPGLSGTVGGVYYSLNGVDDSFEVFGGVSYAFPWLTVGFNVYKEVSHNPGWWLEQTSDTS
jgi:hypothetical protein